MFNNFKTKTMRNFYLEEVADLNESQENLHMYDSDNPFEGSDDEEGRDFYQSYMEGYYYEPGNNEDDE